jgi:hypothetical protein
MNEEITNNAAHHMVTKRDQILKDTIIQKLGYMPPIENLVIRMRIQKRGNLEFFELDGEDLICFYPPLSEIADGKVKVKQNYKILF